MKQVHILLAICFLLVCMNAAAYGENGNPYPPPRHYNGTGNTARSYEDSAPSAEAMIVDLVAVRPLSFAGYVIGIGAAIVATPFSLVTGTTRQVYDKLLNEPFDFTFRRPVGEF